MMDANITSENLTEYFKNIHEHIMFKAKGTMFRGERNHEWVRPKQLSGNNVADLQKFLKEAGFFPFGKIDGLYGYRTMSSIRLFQEYVRTIEGDESIGSPDGLFGTRTHAHVDRWKTNGIWADWINFSSQNQHPEYRRWMELMRRVKIKYLVNPTSILRMVNEYSQLSDTAKVTSWDLNPDRIHLIGVRRNADASLKWNTSRNKWVRENDDIFILLIRGLVFKFFGTTDPGSSSNPKGAPFLVHGQHHYRFGWHRLKENMIKCYLALRPLTKGVLVVRDGDRDMALSDSDISGAKLESNNTINVHWGGRGGLSNWSAGCQVICGKGYINHRNEKVDCSEFAASRYGDIGLKNDKGWRKTKGAYTTLVDLVAAFSGDVHAANYMLLYEADLELSEEIGASEARRILNKLS